MAAPLTLMWSKKMEEKCPNTNSGLNLKKSSYDLYKAFLKYRTQSKRTSLLFLLADVLLATMSFVFKGMRNVENQLKTKLRYEN